MKQSVSRQLTPRSAVCRAAVLRLLAGAMVLWSNPVVDAQTLGWKPDRAAAPAESGLSAGLFSGPIPSSPSLLPGLTMPQASSAGFAGALSPELQLPAPDSGWREPAPGTAAWRIPMTPLSAVFRQEYSNLTKTPVDVPLNPFLQIRIPLPESRYGNLPEDEPYGTILYESGISLPDRTTFDWNGALGQSFLFLTGLHTLRVALQPETRAELGGPFWKDYIKTVGSLGGWKDGDTITTNYVLHPMMGAVAGYIQIQNDPDGKVSEFGPSSEYVNSRLQAFGWAAAFSFMFELGPLSEANIGNVGMNPRDSSEHPMAWVDLVVTPVMGTVWLVGEDALDRYVVNRVEDTGWNNHVKATFRVALNPCRAIANIARLKTPWHRD